MRREYCYLPILRAKQGEFRAVAALSPLARARLIPMFDLPSPVLRNGESLESFLAECAIGAYKAWGSTRSVYVDIHDIPPDVRTRSAQQPVEHLFDVLRDHGMLAIPVTGTEADRGSDYLTAVRSIAGRDQRGACLRLAHDDLTQPYTLAHAVKTTLDHLSLSTLSVDVVLDFRCIGGHKIDDLRAIILESLQALFTVGEFRNMVLAGGSVPQVLGKRDVGVERRVMRAEFGLWQYIAKNSRGNVPIALGDYGVIYAHYVPPQGRVIVPPRIRYTAAREHAFYRGKHGEYRTLCEQVAVSSDFSGLDFSAGDHFIARCAQGIGSPGNQTSWVAADTNHHLEIVSAQAWQAINESGQLAVFLLPEPDRRPWLQPALV